MHVYMIVVSFPVRETCNFLFHTCALAPHQQWFVFVLYLPIFHSPPTSKCAARPRQHFARVAQWTCVCAIHYICFQIISQISLKLNFFVTGFSWFFPGLLLFQKRFRKNLKHSVCCVSAFSLAVIGDLFPVPASVGLGVCLGSCDWPPSVRNRLVVRLTVAPGIADCFRASHIMWFKHLWQKKVVPAALTLTKINCLVFRHPCFLVTGSVSWTNLCRCCWTGSSLSTPDQWFKWNSMAWGLSGWLYKHEGVVYETLFLFHNTIITSPLFTIQIPVW